LERGDVGEIAVIDIAHLSVPLALEIPERLSFVRNTFLDILIEYDVSSAAIRIPESSRFRVRNTTVERYFLEGVLQECLASSMVNRFVVARGASLATFAGWSAGQFKVLCEAASAPSGLGEAVDWPALSIEGKESLVAAYAAVS
jgi:hypothetical protein